MRGAAAWTPINQSQPPCRPTSLIDSCQRSVGAVANLTVNHDEPSALNDRRACSVVTVEKPRPSCPPPHQIRHHQRQASRCSLPTCGGHQRADAWHPWPHRRYRSDRLARVYGSRVARPAFTPPTSRQRPRRRKRQQRRQRRCWLADIHQHQRRQQRGRRCHCAGAFLCTGARRY